MGHMFAVEAAGSLRVQLPYRLMLAIPVSPATSDSHNAVGLELKKHLHLVIGASGDAQVLANAEHNNRTGLCDHPLRHRQPRIVADTDEALDEDH